MIILLYCYLSHWPCISGNVLDCGDHVPWHRPLDGESDSLIRHMLITEDPQLRPCQSSYGMFQFRQVGEIRQHGLHLLYIFLMCVKGENERFEL